MLTQRTSQAPAALRFSIQHGKEPSAKYRRAWPLPKPLTRLGGKLTSTASGHGKAADVLPSLRNRRREFDRARLPSIHSLFTPGSDKDCTERGGVGVFQRTDGRVQQAREWS